MPGGLGISFEMDRNRGQGAQGFIRRLDGIGRRADDMTPALKKIRKSFFATERYLFESGGAGQWQPNTPATLRRKARHGQGDRVMRAKGDLYRALTAGQGPTAVDEVHPDSLALGVIDPAAAVAQRSSNPARRRRLIQMTKARRAKWTRVIADHLTKGGKP